MAALYVLLIICASTGSITIKGVKHMDVKEHQDYFEAEDPATKVPMPEKEALMPNSKNGKQVSQPKIKN